MDNVHFNGLFYNTMPTASSSTVPQCVKSDPNLFKDDVDIRFSKTFNMCKVRDTFTLQRSAIGTAPKVAAGKQMFKQEQ